MTTLCSHCGFNNPPGMRFCGNCGTRLNLPCPSGGPAGDSACLASQSPATSIELSQDPGAMVGADLVERFRQAGLEASGQRRNVTVLFTDLSGYTALSQQLDSEDVYDIIQQYIRLLQKDVYQYEGIVDKLTGDGLMALFGAPIAHENNAERAVRAALDMQADVRHLSEKIKNEHGIELQMRVGLHSGTVIVGGVGSNLMMDYTAIGDTVNLASRIEEAAGPGTILISKTVYRQVKNLFECQPVATPTMKGISHPVDTYCVLGLKSRPGLVRGIEGLRAPMIGRDRELKQLQQAIARLVHQKQGQFIMITGEAGLGKSRLTREFKASLETFPGRILEGQSLAYRRSISYWMFLDVLYSYLGLPQSTPQLQLRERLVQLTYAALGSQAPETLPFLEHLLSLPYSDPVASGRLRYLDAGQLRQQIFLAVRDLLVAESRRRPLLIILEDLHWADDASLELLRFLLESLAGAPIFILGISRQVLPGVMAKAVDWAQNYLSEACGQIQLQNLSLDQSQQLLLELLSLPELPASLREQIVQRSAGVPFYLEEILRMLIDQQAIHYQDGRWQTVPDVDFSVLGVPETLQGLILARFDRLEPQSRHVLQVASVIGKNFSLPVLAAVLQPMTSGDILATLDILIEREFIQPQDEGTEQAYTFRHILMSDAIYGTVLRRQRSRVHGQVGEAIETLYAGRLEGQVELLANHYRWSPRLDRALHYLILAGQKSARNNVNEMARQHYEAALDLLPRVEHTPLQALHIQMGLGDALVFAGEYPVARQHYQDALQAISQQDHSQYADERGALFRKIAKTYERQGDYDHALQYLDQGLHALDCASNPIPVQRAQVWNDIGWIHFRRGNLPEAQGHIQSALDLVEASDAYDAISSIYNRLGGIAYNLGNWDTAASYLRKSIAIRESIHDLAGLAASFSNLGYLEIEMGEFDNALKNITRSYELNARLGQAEGMAIALINLGWLRTQRGESEQAFESLEEALNISQQIGYSFLVAQALKTTGELHLSLEAWDNACKVLEQTSTVLKELEANDQLLDIYRLQGEAALGAGDLPRAQDWSDKAQKLLDQIGNEVEELSAVLRGELRRFRGMLAIRQGDWNEAYKYLRESKEIFQKLRSRLYQGRVAYQFGELAEAQGDRRAAQMNYREAALLFQSIDARLEAQRAEEASRR